MNVVLHQPLIPHNTGAVGRTCLVTGAQLHLIHPLGFSLDEKHLKRCGLDYWRKLNVREYDDFAHFLRVTGAQRFFLVETGGTKNHTQPQYQPGDYFIFGSETVGLPANILAQNDDKIITLPMIPGERSLNLSVTVGIVLYEALRQTGFALID
ncbi:MAG: tRNA (cytidine(34)-2'-O)-methyltransferase [Defluviitaleaceae bacterium]|nr:tRNA (cytidine(34)-2'-O)-methyltransferase [Defluviitaleaceae bacterium]